MNNEAFLEGYMRKDPELPTAAPVVKKTKLREGELADLFHKKLKRKLKQ